LSRNALGRLHDLAVFVGEGEDLGAGLEALVGLAASVTEAAACSIMLLSEGERDAPRLKLWCATPALPASARDERPGPGDPIAGRVLASGEPLLVEDIRASGLAAWARAREDQGSSFICTPIVVGRHVIGVMSLSNRPDAPPFGEADLRLAQIVATLIGKSVQVERLQTLLRSRVAHASLAREEKAVVTRLTDGTVPPARLAKLLARSFFRDLSAAGFEPGQIIDAASEIVSLVSADLGRFRRRKRGER
jgi:GAF domain-containing protein